MHNLYLSELLIVYLYLSELLIVFGFSGLIPCDSDNLADPYVRLYLLPDRSSASKRKTQTKKNDLNPIYDETYIVFNSLLLCYFKN